VVYKKGSENRVTDALSRRNRDPAECCSLSAPTPQWLQLVLTSYNADEYDKDLVAKLSLNPKAVPNFTLHNGLLRYKSRNWVGSDPVLHDQLISALHTSAIGVHSGVPVTYRRLKQLFAWRGMKTAVHKYVQNCQTCIQAKLDRASYPEKLQPLPNPAEAWETISMDFIEGLPHSNRAKCILVVVDKFIQYPHFIPLSHPYTASSVAVVFLKEVYKFHGLPTSIISDRDIISSTFGSAYSSFQALVSS
jgi:hypothetical protein